jgi:hypothetical protein
VNISSPLRLQIEAALTAEGAEHSLTVTELKDLFALARAESMNLMKQNYLPHFKKHLAQI